MQIYPKDTRDTEGRYRFCATSLADMVTHRKHVPNWFFDTAAYPVQEGFQCCAPDFIGTHYVQPSDMFTYHKLLYQSTTII